MAKFSFALLTAYLLGACSADIPEATIFPADDCEQWGTLELSLGSATRATSTVISKEEADNYWVTVYKGQGICQEKTRLIYSFLKNNGFGNSKRKIASKARKVAHALQKIGDKYFPQEQLMSITNGDEEVVWTDCFPEFWRYLLSGLVPGENRERM